MVTCSRAYGAFLWTRQEFEAAHKKLRSEGNPVDPDMTLREAYEVLGLA